MDWEKIITGTLFALGLLLVVGLVVVVTQAALANGKAQYCYIEMNAASDIPMWRLYGFRPWRTDRHIGTFSTLNEALQNAETLQCKVE